MMSFWTVISILEPPENSATAVLLPRSVTTTCLQDCTKVIVKVLHSLTIFHKGGTKYPVGGGGGGEGGRKERGRKGRGGRGDGRGEGRGERGERGRWEMGGGGGGKGGGGSLEGEWGGDARGEVWVIAKGLLATY